MGSIFAALVLVLLIAGGFRSPAPAGQDTNKSQCQAEHRPAPVSMPTACASFGRQCRDLTVPFIAEDDPACPDED